MQVIKYPLFKETFYTEKLPNGLEVNLLPRPKFHQTYATFTARYGSINNTFMPLGENKFQTFPKGIAHFLEHKLFEKEDYDAFDIFAKYGADANAFTSFTRTSYLFSTADNVLECTEALLDFVQHPYFSERTVEKEKGIIGQEIKMYEDDVSWQLLFGVIKNLYPGTALTTDIVGSVASIAHITPEMLYTCYHTFYQPQNMSLFIVGNFECQQLFQMIQETQQEIEGSKETIRRHKLFMTAPPIIPYAEIKMDILRPRYGIGVRGNCILKSTQQRLIYKIKLQFLLELLFGEVSTDYQRLYDAGIIDDSFEYEIQFEKEFCFVFLSVETDHLTEARQGLIEILLNAPEKVKKQKKVFAIMKKEFLGRYIKELNSNENIASEFDQWLFGSTTLFDMVPLLQKITLNDLVELASELFKKKEITEFQILPKKV